MSNVMINIASEFDSKGFKKAETSTSALEKQAKKLGKTLLAAFSAQKIMQYSKASVLAYANDQKAAALLSNQLKNLGLSYSAVGVEKFIAELQKQTGILDDELRPAFTNLVRITGSVAETQKLMMTAFDASRGAGIEYSQAIQLISRAYVGNYKGLKQLNLGLSDAELKTKSFDEVLTLINQKFKGAGAASVDTYAGKIDLLKVSLADAQETIGKGFVDAFEILAKDQNFNDVTDSISTMALNVADAIRGIGVALNYINANTPSWLKSLLATSQKTSLVGILATLGKDARMKDTSTSAGTSYYSKVAADKQAAAAAAKLAKSTNTVLNNNKKITAEKKAQAALDKATSAANALLNQANTLFDLERIGVAAAMQNQTLTENERKRLEIKQATFALEDALDSKDTKRIENATKLLAGLISQFSVLQAQDTLLGQVKSALDALGVNKDLINLQNLKDAYDLLIKMNLLMNSKTTIPPTTTIGGSTGGITAGSGFDPGNFRWKDEGNVGNMPGLPGSIGIGSNWNPGGFRWKDEGNVGTPVVNINISENVKNLVDIIMDTVTEQSASGNPPIVTRVGQNLAW